jgi:hypothetical protein
MAPHREQGWPASGTQPLHTEQPQFRMTGSLSSPAQSGLLHRKSARLHRASTAATACAAKVLPCHLHACPAWNSHHELSGSMRIRLQWQEQNLRWGVLDYSCRWRHLNRVYLLLLFVLCGTKMDTYVKPSGRNSSQCWHRRRLFLKLEHAKYEYDVKSRKRVSQVQPDSNKITSGLHSPALVIFWEGSQQEMVQHIADLHNRAIPPYVNCQSQYAHLESAQMKTGTVGTASY